MRCRRGCWRQTPTSYRHFWAICLTHASSTVPCHPASSLLTSRSPDLDAGDVKSYRPITSLSVISKVLEQLVARHLVKYLTENGLLPDLQSAYCVHHSTETAVLKLEVHCGHSAGPWLWKSWPYCRFWTHTAAFIHRGPHHTLLQRTAIQTSWGLGGVVITWFTSYLIDRT